MGPILFALLILGTLAPTRTLALLFTLFIKGRFSLRLRTCLRWSRVWKLSAVLLRQRLATWQHVRRWILIWPQVMSVWWPMIYPMY